MHIIINTLSVTPSRGGVKTYLLGLLDGLLEIDREKRITLLCSEHNKHLFDRHNKAGGFVQREVLPIKKDRPYLRILFDQFIVPLYCKKYSNGVLLSQASTSSLVAPLPEVVIIQVPLSVRSIRNEVSPDADITTWTQRLYYDVMLPATLSRADQIVAVSDHLRQNIVESYPWSASKVRVVYEGVNLERFSTESRNGIRTDSTAPYLLFVSTLFSYKRADQAIRAFARVKEKNGWENLRLKLAGKDPGDETYRLNQIARKEEVSDQVDILGVIPHEDMPELYRRACALLFPSTVETFGLPVLEAMACGTPVIASDRMSVPEIVGDAGLVVDPDDEGEMSDAICRLLDDDPLRTELGKAGKQRARTFTWERTAQGVWNALKDAKRSENI